MATAKFLVGQRLTLPTSGSLTLSWQVDSHDEWNSVSLESRHDVTVLTVSNMNSAFLSHASIFSIS